MELSVSTFEEPVAAGRRAQLLLAMLLLSLFPICLLYIPIQTHSVKIDLPHLPETVLPTVPAGSGPPAYLLTTFIIPDLELEPPRPLHELVITPQDKVLWNGKAVDLAGLRTRLNIIVIRNEWVDFRPEPHARYEFFAEILAVAKRARLERMRLDSRPFRKAIDERPEPPVFRRRR
jgi:biopolymer transport protein ExbD